MNRFPAMVSTVFKFNKPINYYMIECNYSKEIVNKNIETNPDMAKRYNRLIGSHFSLENVKEFFKAQDLSECKKIILLHLSTENSNAELFKTEIMKITGCPVEIAEA